MTRLYTPVDYNHQCNMDKQPDHGPPPHEQNDLMKISDSELINPEGELPEFQRNTDDHGQVAPPPAGKVPEGEFGQVAASEKPQAEPEGSHIEQMEQGGSHTKQEPSYSVKEQDPSCVQNSISESETAATPEMLAQHHQNQSHHGPDSETMSSSSYDAALSTAGENPSAPHPQDSMQSQASLASSTASTSSAIHSPRGSGLATVSSTPTSIRAARDALHQSAQQLIEDINLKRQQDTQLTADYRKALQAQVDKSMERLDQHMYELYARQSTAIQDKIQQLFATLERIDRIEEELQQFKQALGLLYEDVKPTS